MEGEGLLGRGGGHGRRLQGGGEANGRAARGQAAARGQPGRPRAWAKRGGAVGVGGASVRPIADYQCWQLVSTNCMLFMYIILLITHHKLSIFIILSLQMKKATLRRVK